MQQHEALAAKRYFTPDEIAEHLEGVEYIIMAEPAPDVFKKTPIHLTVFLNTQERLPSEIKDAILDKFCKDHNITRTDKLLSELQPVAFAETMQETPMPLLLIKPSDIQSIPHTIMHVLDFLADSSEFIEAKEDNLTGWSYSYNS